MCMCTSSRIGSGEILNVVDEIVYLFLMTLITSNNILPAMTNWLAPLMMTEIKAKCVDLNIKLIRGVWGSQSKLVEFLSCLEAPVQEKFEEIRDQKKLTKMLSKKRKMYSSLASTSIPKKWRVEELNDGEMLNKNWEVGIA